MQRETHNLLSFFYQMETFWKMYSKKATLTFSLQMCWMLMCITHCVVCHITPLRKRNEWIHFRDHGVLWGQTLLLGVSDIIYQFDTATWEYLAIRASIHIVMCAEIGYLCEKNWYGGRSCAAAVGQMTNNSSGFCFGAWFNSDWVSLHNAWFFWKASATTGVLGW